MIDRERRAAAAAMLVDRNALRMPIHGRSMLPSLAEPMVLQIASHAGARVGDVLIFRLAEMHVAHRIVAIVGDSFRTCGDAQPDVIEFVRPADVVGRVIAVWSDASAGATRVDDRRHRLRSWYFAHLHPLRRAVRLMRDKLADLAVRARPSQRARTVQRLVDALTGARRSDSLLLEQALSTNAERLRVADERHRCAALLGEAARRLAIVDRLPADVASLLRRARLNAVLGTSRMQRAVEHTIESLRTAGVPFVLLKGAARVYAGAPEAACHPSDDVDVLVRATDVDRAVTALRTSGWTYADDHATVERFRRHHHHAASLFPPSGEFPIELHHALAPPGSLSIATDWEALERYVVPVDGAAGTVLRLDPVGTALHLAIHAVGLTRLRDVALLAQSLVELSEDDHEVLRVAIDAEHRDGVRLAATAALAARIAGIDWPQNRAVDAYLWWAIRREDLPVSLRTRCDAAEAHMAGSRVRWSAGSRLIPWWSRGVQIVAVPPRFVARCASNAAALIYAARLPSHDDAAIS